MNNISPEDESRIRADERARLLEALDKEPLPCMFPNYTDNQRKWIGMGLNRAKKMIKETEQ